MAITLTETVECGLQLFPFQLCRRELNFGSGAVPYYWMDGRQFRRRNPGPNFRACVDLWWKAVEEAGAAHEIDNQVNLFFAECYPLVNTSRSLQDVYVDAQLDRRADREFRVVTEAGDRQVRAERTYSLPQEEVTRLRELAARRDTDLIRAELEALFLGEMPSQEDMPAFQAAAQAWAGNGLVALRQHGRSGLQRIINEIGEWIQKCRKQGNQDKVRRFLNMFSYQCKAAFYLCHTSAWVGLTQRLAGDGHLTPVAERFLRLWHCQNQPADDDGGVPGRARDAFFGQVLSLHPLSAIVLNEPFHLITIGRWLTHPEYDALHRANRVGTCQEYWDVVATILVAAHEYNHARTHWEARRTSVTFSNSNDINDIARDREIESAALAFEDYAVRRQLVCPQCDQSLSYFRHEIALEAYDQVVVVYRCRSGHELSLNITEEDLRGAASPD